MNELVSLTDAKAALYEALQPFSLNGCFLRFSDTPEGLLVCDLPRRGGDLAGAEEALTRPGLAAPAGKTAGAMGSLTGRTLSGRTWRAV